MKKKSKLSEIDLLL